MFSSRVNIVGTTFALLAAGGLAACDSAGEDNEDGHFYCADANGNVVDEDVCNDNSDDGSFFFWYMGSSVHAPSGGHSTYRVGEKLPAKAQKFSLTDKAARKSFGLPPTGGIKNGQIKTGVIGRGGPASNLKAGSGGG